jgi:hypothetical protein
MGTQTTATNGGSPASEKVRLAFEIPGNQGRRVTPRNSRQSGEMRNALARDSFRCCVDMAFAELPWRYQPFRHIFDYQQSDVDFIRPNFANCHGHDVDVCCSIAAVAVKTFPNRRRLRQA